MFGQVYNQQVYDPPKYKTLDYMNDLVLDTLNQLGKDSLFGELGKLNFVNLEEFLQLENALNPTIDQMCNSLVDKIDKERAQPKKSRYGNYYYWKGKDEDADLDNVQSCILLRARVFALADD